MPLFSSYLIMTPECFTLPYINTFLKMCLDSLLPKLLIDDGGQQSVLFAAYILCFVHTVCTISAFDLTSYVNLKSRQVKDKQLPLQKRSAGEKQIFVHMGVWKIVGMCMCAYTCLSTIPIHARKIRIRYVQKCLRAWMFLPINCLSRRKSNLLSRCQI